MVSASQWHVFTYSLSAQLSVSLIVIVVLIIFGGGGTGDVVCCSGDGKVLFFLVLRINPPPGSCVSMTLSSFDTTWRNFMLWCCCWSARQGTPRLCSFGCAWAA